MRLRGDKGQAASTAGLKSPSEASFQGDFNRLKRRPTRAAALRGAAINDAVNTSDSDGSAAGSDSEQSGAYTGIQNPKVSQLAGGDDIDSDRPVKRTRLSLSRAIIKAPIIEDDDTDGTPALDEPEDAEEDDASDSNNAAVGQELTDDEIAADLASDQDEQLPLLSTPSATNRAQPSPARRGGRRGRGGRGKLANIGRGRGFGTPKKNGYRDESTEAHGILDKLPGRRRAHHADMDIEVSLRRQLELRVAYRAVAKHQKVILAELTDRTMKDLQADPELYKQFPEYQEVIDGLDECLQQRLKEIDLDYEIEAQRLKVELKAKEDLLREQYRASFKRSQDDYILHGKFRFLHALRWVDEELRLDVDANNPLNDVGPVYYELQDSAPQQLLPQQAYVGERRHLTDTYQHWENFERRFSVGRAQSSFDPASFRMLSAADVMSREELEEAMASFEILVEAAAATHKAEDKYREKRPTVLPNSAAIGLNILADAMFMRPPVESPRAMRQMRQEAVSVPVPVAEKTQTEQAVANWIHRAQEKKPRTPPPPPPGSLRSPPVTPRSQPFVPSISNIMNAADSVPAPAKAGPTLQAPSVQPERRMSAGQISRRPQGTAQPSRPPAAVERPGVTIEPLNAPARQALASQASTPVAPLYPYQYPAAQMSYAPLPPTEVEVVFDPAPKRARKRPGPRAIYTKQTKPDIAPPGQMYWSPFQNSMGPPTYMPKYVKDEELRRPSIPGKSAEAQDVATPRETMPITSSTAPRPEEPQRRASQNHQQAHRVEYQHAPAHPAHSDQHPPTARTDKRGEKRPSLQSANSASAALDQQAGQPPKAYYSPHQNIYYQGQTFYGPYAPTPPPPPGQAAHAPPPKGHAATPPVKTQSVTASAATADKVPAASATAQAPHPPAPQYPYGPSPPRQIAWPASNHSARPGPPAVGSPSLSRDTRGAEHRTSVTEKPENRRQDGPLPPIATIAPPQPSAHNPYTYPRYPSWSTPGGSHERQGSSASPYGHPRYPHDAGGYFDSQHGSRMPARRVSHVPLLTPTSKPLPSYAHSGPTTNRHSIGTVEERTQRPKSPTQPPQPPQPHQPPQVPKEPARHAELEKPAPAAPAAPINDKQDPPQRQAIIQQEARSNTPSATKKSARNQPPPEPIVHPVHVQAQHPNFKGQRPKHHEWRNWTSAVPPPSSGANNNSPATSVPTIIPPTNNGPPSQSRNPRRKKNGSDSGRGRTPGIGETPTMTTVRFQEPQVLQQNQPPQQQGPPQREWRFESQNRKFEGA